jgi:DNA helicase II / ATP-dependent DNA helicase PcrA
MKKAIRRQVATPKAAKTDPSTPLLQWQVGEQVLHGKFGVGEVTHVFGAEGKVSLAVKFEGVATKKVLDPQAVGLRKFDGGGDR